MKFDRRSYGGKFFRPAPQIHEGEGLPLVIVSTAWGSQDSAGRVIDKMLEYLQLAEKDGEVTAPFPRMTCLTTAGNNLRIAALLANSMLYKDENQQEYNTGCELFACFYSDNEVTWIQVGQPNIVLCRNGESPMPLGSFPDLVLDYEKNETALSPLPSNLLGMENSLNLNINSYRPAEGDQLFLISRSRIPAKLFTMQSEKLNLDLVSRTLAEDRQDQPFWLGSISL